MLKNKNNQTTEEVVEETQKLFAEYFNLVGGKKFKQFYYDWHINNMLAPFAELVSYFHTQYGDKAPNVFHEFVQDFRYKTDTYNADKPQLSMLKDSRFAKDNTGKFSALIDGVETFGFSLRQFLFNFSDRKDHDAVFRGWPVRPNMPYASWYGLLAAEDILEFLDKNYVQIISGKNPEKRALAAADIYMRKKIAPSYQYNDQYNFSSRYDFMEKFVQLRDALSEKMQKGLPENSPLRDTFQVEQEGSTTSKGYWPCGFELEFYVPEEYKDYDKLMEYLKQTNNWHKLYSSNKDETVYHDENSAGVIMRDESLVRYNKLAAVEYASAIMKNKESEERCLKILDSFEEGHVNVHCSLHQHLSADELSLNAYKRLLKRMMQHEDKIVSAFAAPERHDNKLLYATYISRNLSPDGKKDYPFLCLMVDLCDDKRELQEFASFGHKYKTLNIMPKHTVEMRFMNANFNKKFVQAYLQFNREFVQSAAENNPCHLNKALLNKYTWQKNRQTDKKTVIHGLPYYYQYEYDLFQPTQRPVSKEVIEQEQKYWRLTMHALTETGKVPYLNAGFYKKFRESKSYGK